MENNYESRFDSAARAVCDRLRNYLFLLPTDMKEQAQEIRFRVNQPVSICCTGGVYFLNRNGRPSCRPEPDGIGQPARTSMRPSGESVAIRYTATKMRSRTALSPSAAGIAWAFAGRR